MSGKGASIGRQSPLITTEANTLLVPTLATQSATAEAANASTPGPGHLDVRPVAGSSQSERGLTLSTAATPASLSSTRPGKREVVMSSRRPGPRESLKFVVAAPALQTRTGSEFGPCGAEAREAERLLLVRWQAA